jgi:hypothetical protein
MVSVILAGKSFGALARIEEGIPPGVVIVPRSMGIPIAEPAPVEIRVSELASR